MADTRWRGNAIALTWVVALSLLSSLTAWVLGVVFTIKVSHTETHNGVLGSKAPSVAETYMYSSAVPMAVMLAAVADSVLLRKGYLWPIVSLIWSILAFGAWICTLTFWGACEFSPDTGSEICPRFYVYRDMIYRSPYWYGRVATGSIAAVLALLQMSYAARAISLGRRNRKLDPR